MQNRRNFIKNSLYTFAGSGLAGKYFSPDGNLSIRNEDNKFIYRSLGKTGVKLPIVSMGTNNTSNPHLIRSALEKGVRLLATAWAYQNGNNERIIGTAIKGIQRDSYLILTNSFDINWIDTKTGIVNSAFSHGKLLKNLKESLSRLNLEYVDIFMQPFAASRESVFHDKVLKSMEALKKEGLTRFIGIATHRTEPEAINAAMDVDIHDVVMTSYNFLKTNREELNDVINNAAVSGLGIIAMKTMAGVYWDKERKMPINTRAALKWVLQNENIHTAVPDCSDFEQLSRNIEIMSDLKLTEEELKDLIPPAEASLSGLFCQQCGDCLSQCPNGLDIPGLMRSYMYAFGHRNLPYAKMILKNSGFRSDICTGCIKCNISCRMGFDIKDRIRQLSGLEDVPDDFIYV